MRQTGDEKMINSMNQSQDQASKGTVARAGRASSAMIVALLSFTAGCDILDVTGNPDVAIGDAVAGPGAFQARLIGSQSDFAVALGEAAAWGGLFTDELVWGGSTQERNHANLRVVTSDNIFIGNGLWTPLQIAAKSSNDLMSDIAAGNFPNQVPDGTESETFAHVAVLTGYTRVLLADLFCTVAFDGTGPELTTQEAWGKAEEYFSNAIEASQASGATHNVALVGRARVRLQIGDLQGALADAQSVEPGFEYFVEYSGNSGRETNELFSLTWDIRFWPVGPEFRNLTIDDTGIPDPRVEVFDTGELSFNGGVRQFNPVKYDTRSAPIRLASWLEAQYIIAEILGGNQARDIINNVRAALGIDMQFDPMGEVSDTEILLKVLDERARTLFLEAQRMPDLRRFRERHAIDQFPTGPDIGDQVCMPLPDIERANNPGI